MPQVTYYLKGRKIEMPSEISSRLIEKHVESESIGKGSLGEVHSISGIPAELNCYYPKGVVAKTINISDYSAEIEASFFSAVNQCLTIVITYGSDKDKAKVVTAEASDVEVPSAGAGAGAGAGAEVSSAKALVATSKKAKIFMPFLEGENLENYLNRLNKAKLTEEKKDIIRLRVFLAFIKMSYRLHSEMEVIHGDAKSPNFLIRTTPDQKLVLEIIDFGHAYHTNNLAVTTPSECIYWIPERTKIIPDSEGEYSKPVPKASPKHDIYSFIYYAYFFIDGMKPILEELFPGINEDDKVIPKTDEEFSRLVEVLTIKKLCENFKLFATLPEIMPYIITNPREVIQDKYKGLVSEENIDEGINAANEKLKQILFNLLLRKADNILFLSSASVGKIREELKTLEVFVQFADFISDETLMELKAEAEAIKASKRNRAVSPPPAFAEVESAVEKEYEKPISTEVIKRRRVASLLPSSVATDGAGIEKEDGTKMVASKSSIVATTSHASFFSTGVSGKPAAAVAAARVGGARKP